MKHLIRPILWSALASSLLLGSSLATAHTPSAARRPAGAVLTGMMTTQQAREDLARRASRWHGSETALQIGDFTRRLDRPQPAVLPG